MTGPGRPLWNRSRGNPCATSRVDVGTGRDVIGTGSICQPVRREGLTP